MQPSASGPAVAADTNDVDTLACSLPPSELGRRRVTLAEVVGKALDARESETGVILCFDGSDEIATTVFDLVMAERACCARFTYAMVFDPQQSRLELTVESPSTLRQALKTLYLDQALNR